MFELHLFDLVTASPYTKLTKDNVNVRTIVRSNNLSLCILKDPVVMHLQE